MKRRTPTINDKQQMSIREATAAGIITPHLQLDFLVGTRSPVFGYADYLRRYRVVRDELLVKWRRIGRGDAFAETLHRVARRHPTRDVEWLGSTLCSRRFGDLPRMNTAVGGNEEG